jgi:hypothetical protein
VQNATRHAAERARNSNDRTHSLVLSGVMEGSTIFATSSWSRACSARDWTGVGDRHLPDGTPPHDCAGSDRNFDGLTNDRADLVGNPELDHGRRSRN